MATTSSTQASACGASSFGEKVDPAVSNIVKIWMEITDIKCELKRVVDENVRAFGTHGDALQRATSRLDALLFDGIDALEQFYALADAPKHTNGSPTVLPVNALDAYLSGTAALPRATVSRGIQTEPSVPIVSPAPSPIASKPTAFGTQSAKVFDMLRNHHQRRDVKPKEELSHAPASGSKRPRYDSSMATEGNEATKRARTPRNLIKGRKPIAVHGFRERLSMREYAVEFEGLQEHVWLVSRRSPPEVRTLIQAYALANRGKRPTQTKVTEDAEDAGDTEGDDPDGIYIVEKIVDHRFRYGKKQYFVKWDGYDTDENTWEPAAKLRSEVQEIVEEYERELAKASSRKNADDAKAKGLSISSMGGKPKRVALGRPSNPSALTKSTSISQSTLLERSGKIPRVQFLINEKETDDEDEDSDLLRLAASDEDQDDENSDSDNGSSSRPYRNGGKGPKPMSTSRRQAHELSPQIE